MGRETTDGSQDETSTESEISARIDPDSTPGVIVDKRPEKVWSVSPVLFWFTIAMFILVGGVWGANAWLYAHFANKLFSDDPYFGSMLSEFLLPFQRVFLMMAFLPLVSVAMIFYFRSAGRRGANTRKVKLVLVGVMVPYVFAIAVVAPLEMYGLSTFEITPAILLAAAGVIALIYSIDPNARVALHCRKCGYEFVPGEDAPKVCPECGRNWLRRRGLVRRRHQKRLTPLKITGMMLQVLAFLAWVSAGKLHALVPIDWLIPRAGHPYSLLPPSDWAKLHPSSLTDEQLVRLAEVLLDKREAGKEIDTLSTDGWFEAALAGDSLSEDLVRRLHHHWFRFQIAAPTDVRIGVAFETALDVWWEPRSFASRSVWIVFGGFRLDDEDPVARMVAARAPIRIARMVHIGSDATANPDYPYASFTPERAGQHTITAEYWLIAILGSANLPNVTWNQDGSLQEPSEALYFRRFEISETIDVLPP